MTDLQQSIIISSFETQENLNERAVYISTFHLTQLKTKIINCNANSKF